MENENSTRGISFLGLLCIAFIVLKLIGVIDWSWWLILSPIFAIPLIFLSLIIIGSVISFIAFLIAFPIILIRNKTKL